MYEESVKWSKNHFLLPTGQCGKDLLILMIEWLRKFNTNSCFQGIALKVFFIIPNMMLQKPSAKSKTREHAKLLEERLKKWKDGKLSEIWKEAITIQKKLKSTKRKKTDADITMIFSNLMFEGKVGAALKFLEKQSENAVLQPTEDVIRKLQELHPKPGEIQPNTLIYGPINETSPAYFYSIDEDQIRRAANATHGSGGPSQLDGKQWKRLLCCNKLKHVNTS